MRLIRAARFAGVAALAAGIYSLLVLRPVYLESVQTPHPQAAAEESYWQWELGGWLWLLTIFSWMILLAAMKHYYSPVHRISTNTQSGLTVISATLLIVGVLVGMNRFGLRGILYGNSPVETVAAVGDFVDYVALTILAAGLLMGGCVTTWICVDLVILNKLPVTWMVPGAVAGVLSFFSPILLPEIRHLLVALLAYCVWCIVLGMRYSLPAAYLDLE
ncbi:MAG: hypothetical protein F4148_03630 [Caldilineaceae bacterium SB0675_bin_29]|uniref:DUF4386 family protein n=1 Tax=Caldilineaceae bacterium SB0675_bin_29 TaxID=2605266 RepID=A0A6B1G0C0_9CHLR|nr:hypothetical protein [Caldilineaceae bacterium SB0675_bin_29]